MDTGATQPGWRGFLEAHGAVFDRDRVLRFSDPGRNDREAVCVPLTDYGVLRVEGDDSMAFLQAQLTCDLRQVSATQARFGGYCTPKGRLLATMLLWSVEAGYRIMLPAALLEPVAGRLRRYILRARVRIEPERSLALIGVVGPRATDAIARAHIPVPESPLSVTRAGATVAVRLSAGSTVLAVPDAEAPARWETLCKLAIPSGAAHWDRAQVADGVGWIFPRTQELFLPQSVGLDANSGVSFDKGCYPGQEIVARTHYLGNLKRRLYLGRASGPVQPGDELLPPGSAEAAGTVVNAAPSPDGAWDVLAVLRSDTVHGGVLRVKANESIEATGIREFDTRAAVATR